MRKLLILPLLDVAAFAADPAPDWQAIAQGLRSQRDQNAQAAQDAQLQVALLQAQAQADAKKIADLTGQLEAAKKPKAAPAAKSAATPATTKP